MSDYRFSFKCSYRGSVWYQVSDRARAKRARNNGISRGHASHDRAAKAQHRVRRAELGAGDWRALVMVTVAAWRSAKLELRNDFAAAVLNGPRSDINEIPF